jgi:hypothetical protein
MENLIEVVTRPMEMKDSDFQKYSKNEIVATF